MPHSIAKESPVGSLHSEIWSIQENYLTRTYKLAISAPFRRLLGDFPLPIQREMNERIGNTLALPVEGDEWLTTVIEVAGYKATLRLEPLNRTVRVLAVESPRSPAGR